MPDRSGAWRLAYRVAGGLVGATATAVDRVTRREELHERLGHGEPLAPGLRPLWFHGASVGELATIRPLVDEITSRWPEVRVGHTATTPTGRDAARREIPDAIFTRLLPLDAWPALGRFLRRVDPGAVIVVETELWPGLLRELVDRDIPTALASARMSARSHLRYRRVRGLFQEILPRLALVAARTADDRERFVSLGACPDRTLVLGNTKHDTPAGEGDGAWSQATEEAFARLLEDRHAVVWGCLRPLEEETAFALMKSFGGDRAPLWVLAPRHLTEFDRVASALDRAGLRATRWSRCLAGEAGVARPDVLLVDTLGELRHVYAHADVAIVGGTYASYGGHNLMEPARYGVPVLFGPDTSSWPDDAERLLAAGGGSRAYGPQDLESRLRQLLDAPEERTRVGRAAREAAESGHGASRRIVDALDARDFFARVRDASGASVER